MDPAIRNVSDTATWAALYRARETEHPKALFQDPFAARLAGDRGRHITTSLTVHDSHAWAWVMRTVLFDRAIMRAIDDGVDLVVNLAAGLDARPYRLALPPSLRWVEVDLPGLVAYKARVLEGEKTVCRLERVSADLSDRPARQALFDRLVEGATRALVLTEGLLVYLSREEVGELATDLAERPAFDRWVTDLGSPGLVKMLQKQVGKELDQASAPLKFGPPEGPAFFEPYGWTPIDVQSTFRAAARLKRLPFFLRLFAIVPDSNGQQGSRPWSATVVLGRKVA